MVYLHKKHPMKFWKAVAASIVGGLIVILLASLFFSALIGGAIAGLDKETIAIKDKTVLQLNVNYAIPERSTDGPTPVFSPFGLDVRDAVGLQELVAAIDHAATDDRIAGIQLELGAGIDGMATFETIRDALHRFSATGKFIYGYGELLDEKNLYLAAVADSVWINPAGVVEFNGFAAQPIFFTNALEKLGVDVQVFYYGKYKSFTEPFRLTKMSEPNREQVTAYLNSMYTHYLEGLSADLGISAGRLDSLANALAIFSPKDAEAHGLITATGFEDDIENAMRQRVHGTVDKKVDVLTVGKYYQGIKQDLQPDYNDNWVAVVYMEGDVMGGIGQDGTIGSSTYREQFKQIRDKKEVKAIVLRINTNGGSSLASEVMHHSLMQVPDSIPIVVSMGDVCASAGYHISTTADYIVAAPTTITGSIGVLALLPNMKTLLEDKIGLTTDTVKTGAHADFGNVWRPVSDREREVYQRYIDESYTDFLAHVAAGRGLDSAEVAALAQGRVYTGLQAIDLGLVDTLGGLSTAIDKARELAGLESYYVRSYPPQQDFFDRLEELLGGDNGTVATIDWSGVPYAATLQSLWHMQQSPGLYYRMPYDLVID